MKGLTAIPAQNPAHYIAAHCHAHAPASLHPHMHPIAPRSALSILAHTMLATLPPFHLALLPPHPSLTHLDRRSPGHPATPPWLRSNKQRAGQSVLTCNARTHGCTAGCSKTAARVPVCYRQNSPCRLRGLLQQLGSPRPLRVRLVSACDFTCALACVHARLIALVHRWCGVSVRPVPVDAAVCVIVCRSVFVCRSPAPPPPSSVRVLRTSPHVSTRTDGQLRVAIKRQKLHLHRQPHTRTQSARRHDVTIRA